MSDLYKTIESPSEGTITEKRSKFLAFAYPISTAAEAKDIVAALGKKYFDARHVCWAYMLGADRTEFRANDNGEPSGTAGKPILGQINSLDLTDVLVAVVRYFGGIKLGTPGLIQAYRAAAREALDNAAIVERHVMAHVEFSFPYLAMNDVMKLTKLPGVTVKSTVFDNLCSMALDVELDEKTRLMEALSKIEGININPK